MGGALGADKPVILTREAGKNEELGSLLNAKGIQSIAIPLVRSVDGPERYRERKLASQGFSLLSRLFPSKPCTHPTQAHARACARGHAF